MLTTVRVGIRRRLERRGLIRSETGGDEADPHAEAAPVLAACYAASVQGTGAMGPQAGHCVGRLGGELAALSTGAPGAPAPSYTQVRLDPLPQETAELLLGAMLGSDAALDAVKADVIARTEGNSLFLEESVRELVESGALLGTRGAYRLARPLPAVQVPATVQAVLAARIDRLPPADKALLQTASVIGHDVPFALLQSITETSHDELRGAIGRLQAAEFLYEAGLFPDLEYSFTRTVSWSATGPLAS